MVGYYRASNDAFEFETSPGDAQNVCSGPAGMLGCDVKLIRGLEQ